jgi:hypothetical protein
LAPSITPSEDLAEAVGVDAHGHEHGDVFDLAAPGSQRFSQMPSRKT